MINNLVKNLVSKLFSTHRARVNWLIVTNFIFISLSSADTALEFPAAVFAVFSGVVVLRYYFSQILQQADEVNHEVNSEINRIEKNLRSSYQMDNLADEVKPGADSAIDRIKELTILRSPHELDILDVKEFIWTNNSDDFHTYTPKDHMDGFVSIGNNSPIDLAKRLITIMRVLNGPSYQTILANYRKELPDPNMPLDFDVLRKIADGGSSNPQETITKSYKARPRRSSPPSSITTIH
ncbi:MAG: hypothetical protein PHI71_05785 [Acidiphilium sp.]|nr:hypothetical protein [Acidiphilium sp.]